jgi:hypothetical protein
MMCCGTLHEKPSTYKLIPDDGLDARIVSRKEHSESFAP